MWHGSRETGDFPRLSQAWPGTNFSPALCNYLLPTSNLTLSFPHTVPLQGQYLPNLPSALPRECLISPSLSLTQNYKKKKIQYNTKTNKQKTLMQQRRGREVHKLKATYFAGYAFQWFLFECLYPTMKKKIQKAILPASRPSPRGSPHGSHAGGAGCQRAGPPGRKEDGARCTLTGSPRRKRLDVGPVAGREKAPALAGRSQITIAAS